MGYYVRRLPHWDLIGQPMFVTFRLHGSLPANRVFPPARLTSGEAFVAMDKLLDEARTGPFFLRQTAIAEMVVEALYEGSIRFDRYELHTYVVMPNHVHLLVTPNIPAKQWLGPLKGFTGRRANQMLGRCGPFWQDESFDHRVRDNAEFQKVARYIERNPVMAGLAAAPEEFPWSSAAPGGSPAAG